MGILMRGREGSEEGSDQRTFPFPLLPLVLCCVVGSMAGKRVWKRGKRKQGKRKRGKREGRTGKMKVVLSLVATILSTELLLEFLELSLFQHITTSIIIILLEPFWRSHSLFG